MSLPRNPRRFLSRPSAKASELFAHMSIVFRMARERCDKAWQRYDEQFRQAIAINPNMSYMQYG